MQCVILSGGTYIPSAAEPCDGFMLLTPPEAANVVGQLTAANLEALGVTATSLGEAFAWGFAWVIGVVSVAWVVAVAISLVRKL